MKPDVRTFRIQRNGKELLLKAPVLEEKWTCCVVKVTDDVRRAWKKAFGSDELKSATLDIPKFLEVDPPHDARAHSSGHLHPSREIRCIKCEREKDAE